MLDKAEKELPWPSDRFANSVGHILDSYKAGRLDRTDAIARIALVEPDCDMDDCNNAVHLPVCRECNHLLGMDD